MLRTIERFFVTWRFAVFAIALLGLFAGLVGALLWIPPAPSGLGAFAEEFRIWCFGPQSSSAQAEGFIRFGVFFELLSLAALIGLVWFKPIRTQLQRSARAFVPYVATATLMVVAMAGSLWLLGGQPTDTTIFPARELRTAQPAPRVELTNQDGAPVSLQRLEGRVVLVTGVYASCGLACPRILGQAKRALAALRAEERADLTVIGITLDPERDTAQVLGTLASAQSISTPLYHLLTGEPAAVNRALDAFQIERKRNPETNVIDHANLFVVIDRGGKVAYRFTLGELQEKWMTQALRNLLAESRAVTARRE